MADMILNYVSRRRNRSSGNSRNGKGDSPEHKKAKNTEDSEPQITRTTTARKDPHDEGEENDVVLTALELTDDLGGILKQISEKTQSEKLK